MKAETVGTWLASRQPQRPAALTAHMDRALADADPGIFTAAPTAADALASLGLSMLRQVATHDCEGADLDAPGRDKLALDLLTADAFVTYAFEAAGEERTDVGPLVARLIAESA